MKQLFLYITIISFTVSITAQNVERKFVSAQIDGSYAKVEVNDGYYIVNPYTSQLVETTFIPNGEEYNPESHAVVSQPNISNIEITERSKDILIKTTGLLVTITKSPFQISYYYKDKLIISEKRGYY